MTRFTRLTFSTVALLLSISVGLAAETPNSVDPRKDYLVQISEILRFNGDPSIKRGSPEYNAIQADREIRVNDWLKVTSEQKIDFESEGFVIAFAVYLRDKFANGPRSDSTASIETLKDHLAKYGVLPTSAKNYSGWIARVIPMVLSKVAKSPDVDLKLYHDTLLTLATYGTKGPYAAYTSASNMLPDSAIQYRLLTVRMMLEDDLIKDDEKIHALTYIFSGEKEGAGVSFTSFSGNKFGGGKLDLNDLKGKVVIVDFWATWCGPCLAEMPNVVAVYEELQSQGLEVVGVCLNDSGEEEQIQKTLNRMKMTWPQIYEGGGTESKPAVLNNVYGIPMIFLLDRSGKARFADVRGPMLREKVIELLSEKPSQPQAASLER